MKEALRRATIFVGYAVCLTDGEPLSSVLLNTAIQQMVGVPNPLPEAERASSQREFRVWAIGQALIELDQSYHRFVSSAIETREDIELFAAERRVGQHAENLATTWAVRTSFWTAEDTQPDEHDQEYSHLRTLGNARNCLVHDGGIVSRRRLTEGSVMPIRWLGRDVIIEGPDGGEILPRDRPHRVRREDIGRTLRVAETLRERIYRIGDRVEFAPTDLSEIIFFYQILAMRIGAQMHKHAGKLMNAVNVGGAPIAP